MKTMIRNARVLMHAQRCVKEEAVLIEDGTILDIASECELPMPSRLLMQRDCIWHRGCWIHIRMESAASILIRVLPKQ